MRTTLLGAIALSLTGCRPGGDGPRLTAAAVSPQPTKTPSDTGQDQGPRQFRAGFAAEKISPEILDTWVDVDGNHRYSSTTDSYTDANGNGRFDAFWLAGFDQARPAQKVHDDLFALASVLDDGDSRIAFVAVDAIGIFRDQVQGIRARIPAEWRIDHLVVTATHCHEVPDLMGMWGPSVLATGVNPSYKAMVDEKILSAIGAAQAHLEPARLSLHEFSVDESALLRDTRKPVVLDPGVRMMLLRSADGTRVLGSIVNWANHPETLWRDNLEVTADFVGYLRDGLSAGIRYGDVVRMPGLGGVHLFVNGAIGGLLTTSSTQTVRDPFLEQDFLEPSFEKARAVGHSVAKAILEGIAARPPVDETETRLSWAEMSVEIPVTNLNFLAAAFAGLIQRTLSASSALDTEMALIGVGPARILAIPGEIYPEIINGGVEKPEGADFADSEIVESEPLRGLMEGKVNFIFGLANDEIGYIIPKTEWDEKSPYLYGEKKSPYGEGNSPGPEAGPRIYEAARALLRARD